MRAAIYARVSTTDKGQDPELQLKPLRDYCKARSWTIVEEFTDYCSGAKDTRPRLDELMTAARRRSIDCVAVWKLDRFGRSLKHLVTALDELKSLGVAFVSYQESIDLTTPAGRLMMQIIAAMSEFERELIRERVKAGIANAKAKGKRVGRKPLSPLTVKSVIDFYEGDRSLSIRKISNQVNVPPATVGAILKKYRDNTHSDLVAVT